MKIKVDKNEENYMSDKVIDYLIKCGITPNEMKQYGATMNHYISCIDHAYELVKDLIKENNTYKLIMTRTIETLDKLKISKHNKILLKAMLEGEECELFNYWKWRYTKIDFNAIHDERKETIFKYLPLPDEDVHIWVDDECSNEYKEALEYAKELGLVEYLFMNCNVIYKALGERK